MKTGATIFLTKSNKHLLLLTGTMVLAFLTLCFFYEGMYLVGCIFGLVAAGLLAAATTVKNPKASLKGTILSIEDVDGVTSEWDLKGILAWEILSDTDFDRGPNNRVDNPGILMEFQNGGRVIARCYFDRHLQKDLIKYCVKEKSLLSKREICHYARMYKPFEKEIIDILK